MAIALCVVLTLAGAVVGIQAWRTWRVMARIFSSQSGAVKPGEGASSRVLTTKSGHRVSASWVASKNGAAVLLLHGTDANRTQLWPELELLGAAGFGVLAIDWPGYGESDGLPRLGTAEREAFTAAVDLMANEPGVKTLGVLGFSQGAALATLYAADEPRVKALLCIGAWTDVLVQTGYEYRGGGVLRQWPARLFTRLYLETGNVRPIDAASKLKGRATLYICGANDEVVPPAMSEALAQAAGGELWRIEGAGHGDFRERAQEAWSKRVLAFFGALIS